MLDPLEVFEVESTGFGGMPILCGRCGAKLCDVEGGDTLAVLVRTALGHDCKAQTWTFVGHWENDRIIVEYTLNGEQVDPREDTGYWEQGLFAESASGLTQDEALAKIRARYENLD